METRYYKIAYKGEHFKVDPSIPLVIIWLSLHQSAEFLIVEVQSEEFSEYEVFYDERLECLENTLLEKPEEWQILIGDYYEGEDEYDPDKVMKRKNKLQEQLQNLIPVQR